MRTGTLEVITGPMFSGKTEELVRRLRRAQYANKCVRAFKPAIDNRYGSEKILNHSKDYGFDCQAVSCPSAMDIALRAGRDADIIGIDEVQFFGVAIIPLIELWTSLSMDVIVSGLDTDFRGIPFQPLPHLLAIADNVLKLSAVCFKCGEDARHTQRLGVGGDLIQVGGAEMYQARCRDCFIAGGDPNQLE